MSPRGLADSAREAAREALAAYDDGVEPRGDHGVRAVTEGQYDRQEQAL